MPTAYIALGSNDRPVYHLKRAIRALSAVPTWRMLGQSPVYRSAAIDKTAAAHNGHVAPADIYLNAVVAVVTNLPPLAIRRRLRALETVLGRERATPQRVAIDLDLIAIDAQVLDVDGHHLPDPAIEQHAFVAVPFADVAPTWVHPESEQTLTAIAAKLRHQIEVEIVFNDSQP